MGVVGAEEGAGVTCGRGGTLRTGTNSAASGARSRLISGAPRSAVSLSAVCAWRVGRTCTAAAQGMAGLLRKRQPLRKKAEEQKVRETSSGALRRRSELLERTTCLAGLTMIFGDFRPRVAVRSGTWFPGQPPT